MEPDQGRPKPFPSLVKSPHFIFDRHTFARSSVRSIDDRPPVQKKLERRASASINHGSAEKMAVVHKTGEKVDEEETMRASLLKRVAELEVELKEVVEMRKDNDQLKKEHRELEAIAMRLKKQEQVSESTCRCEEQRRLLSHESNKHEAARGRVDEEMTEMERIQREMEYENLKKRIEELLPLSNRSDMREVLSYCSNIPDDILVNLLEKEYYPARFLGRLLYESVVANRTTVVRNLCQRGYTTMKENERFTSLEIAAKNNNIDILTLLVEAGVNFDDRVNALLMTSDETCRDYLVANIENGKDHARTLAHLGLVWYGTEEEVTNLSDKLDLEKRDHLLFKLVSISRADFVQILLEKGANANAKFDGLTTALHCAALFNDIDIMKLLVDAGADVAAVNMLGISAADVTSDELCREYLASKLAELGETSPNDSTYDGIIPEFPICLSKIGEFVSSCHQPSSPNINASLLKIAMLSPKDSSDIPQSSPDTTISFMDEQMFSKSTKTLHERELLKPSTSRKVETAATPQMQETRQSDDESTLKAPDQRLTNSKIRGVVSKFEEISLTNTYTSPFRKAFPSVSGRIGSSTDTPATGIEEKLLSTTEKVIEMAEQDIKPSRNSGINFSTIQMRKKPITSGSLSDLRMMSANQAQLQRVVQQQSIGSSTETPATGIEDKVVSTTEKVIEMAEQDIKPSRNSGINFSTIQMRKKPITSGSVSDLRMMNANQAQLQRVVQQQSYEQELMLISSSDLNNQNRSVPFDFKSRFADDFNVVKILGCGAFGVVFLAENRIDYWKYAVKRISVELDQVTIQKALKEVRAMAQLDHPGIVRYHHTWIEEPPEEWQSNFDADIYDRLRKAEQEQKEKQDSDISEATWRERTSQHYRHSKPVLIYIKMQLCGYSLAKWLKRQGVTPRDLSRMHSWFKQIVSAVEYIHKKDFIHRDLKPNNILLDGPDLLKICDLGIATQHSSLEEVTRSFNVGSPLYMAPEQIASVNYTSKVDVFSMGLILTELCVIMANNERMQIFSDLRIGRDCKKMEDQPRTAEFVMLLTQHDFRMRPTCTEMLRHPFLAENISKITNMGIKAVVKPYI